MVILVFTLMILTEFSYSQGLWCLDSSCTSCTQGYLYRNHKCLALCPTGYTTSGKICNESSSTLLFSMTTGIPLAFNSRSVNFFYHPSGLEFRDPGKLSPIMTKDRGLYFTSQSTLVSNTSWILSPNFVISYSLRVINEGVVFKITHGNQVILELSASPTTFSSKIFVYSSSLNTTVNLNTIHLDQWVILNFYVNQLSSVLRVIINDKDLYLDKYEFRSQIKSLKYTFGDSTSYSFTGFLYDGFFNNYYENYKNIYFSEIMCGYNEYYFNEACLPCSPSCSDWPWCTRSSCNICYYPSCNSCSDFLISSCTSCSSNTVPYCELGSNCAEGTELICNTCENGFVNIKGVCVLSPYKYDSSNLITPVINTKFNEFKQFYDIFQSGNNSLTYLPFNNGDKDDPNPIKGRGMNFISGEVNYLRSSTKIIIGPEFTIAVWIYAHKNGYFFEKDTIKWFTNGKFMIELSSKEESSLINSLNGTEQGIGQRLTHIEIYLGIQGRFGNVQEEFTIVLNNVIDIVQGDLDSRQEFQGRISGLFQAFHQNPWMQALRDVSIGLAQQFSTQQDCGRRPVSRDIVLSRRRSGNQGRCRMLNLHLLQQD